MKAPDWREGYVFAWSKYISHIHQLLFVGLQFFVCWSVILGYCFLYCYTVATVYSILFCYKCIFCFNLNVYRRWSFDNVEGPHRTHSHQQICTTFWFTGFGQNIEKYHHITFESTRDPNAGESELFVKYGTFVGGVFRDGAVLCIQPVDSASYHFQTFICSLWIVYRFTDQGNNIYEFHAFYNSCMRCYWIKRNFFPAWVWEMFMLYTIHINVY